jgi:hypothetical protein
MKMQFTPAEMENMFHDALCNGLEGLYLCGNVLQYDPQQYKQAKSRLKESSDDVCYEDVLLQILRDGGWLKLVDTENFGDESTISLQNIHTEMPNVPIKYITQTLDGTGDAFTSEAILQYVFFGEVIFG